MIIAFSGMSGSGKTSITKALERKLTSIGYKVVRRAEFEYFLLGYLMIPFSSKKVSKVRSNVLKGGNWRLYRFWLLLVLIDYIVMKLYYFTFRRRWILLLDRCPLDFLVGLRLMGGDSKLLRWLYYRVCSMDKIFVLDVSEDEAYKRELRDPLQKEPPQPELYPLMRREYMKIARDLNLCIVNTGRPLNDTIAEIMGKVMRRLQR